MENINLYINNVIRPLEKMIGDLEIKLLKDNININNCVELKKYEKELNLRYKTLEKIIFEEINIK